MCGEPIWLGHGLKLLDCSINIRYNEQIRIEKYNTRCFIFHFFLWGVGVCYVLELYNIAIVSMMQNDTIT